MELLVLRMLSRDSADSWDDALRVLLVGDPSRPASTSLLPSANSLHSCWAGLCYMQGLYMPGLYASCTFPSAMGVSGMRPAETGLSSDRAACLAKYVMEGCKQCRGSRKGQSLREGHPEQQTHLA